jgi:nitrate/TMAO reductase-like tetraheme cytochrome c subunit
MHRILKLAAMWLLGSMCSLASAASEKPGYDEARWDPLHFRPAIDTATDQQCLSCHKEILDSRVRDLSPAGVKASEAFAWYQTLSTYEGEQETFHRRHLATPYAMQVMKLKCNTCHQGNDPREETAHSSATGDPDLTQRKHVDPNICLMCHGSFDYTLMGLPGHWSENEEAFGSCLTCHAVIRTHRHKVNFLRTEAIESAAKDNSDVCFGCHGGRSWYRIAYPYPRHAWPGGGDIIPDWAKERPTESDPRFLPSEQ